MSVLLPVEHDKEGTYHLVGPDGIPQTWTWADLTWHGPDNRHPTDKVKMSAAFAYSQGYRFAQQPPSSPALYRMRADGLTLEGYIKNRRERVLSMRRQADEQARLVREQLDRADMLETELDCLEASMVRADPENLT